MAYEIIFFYDNRVAVLNTTSYSLLPVVYESISEFMLLTVLNNNQIICDKNEHAKVYEIYEETYNCEAECPPAVDLIKTYDCKEITIRQIKENAPSEGASFEHRNLILNHFRR